jgi:hypothetical protein
LCRRCLREVWIRYSFRPGQVTSERDVLGNGLVGVTEGLYG